MGEIDNDAVDPGGRHGGGGRGVEGRQMVMQWTQVEGMGARGGDEGTF